MSPVFSYVKESSLHLNLSFSLFLRPTERNLFQGRRKSDIFANNFSHVHSSLFLLFSPVFPIAMSCSSLQNNLFKKAFYRFYVKQENPFDASSFVSSRTFEMKMATKNRFSGEFRLVFKKPVPLHMFTSSYVRYTWLASNARRNSDLERRKFKTGISPAILNTVLGPIGISPAASYSKKNHRLHTLRKNTSKRMRKYVFKSTGNASWMFEKFSPMKRRISSEMALSPLSINLVY